MTIQELLQQTGMPAQYGVMDEMCDPPFIVYLGTSPGIFSADNIPYIKTKTYQVEYYFKTKNEAFEEQLENLLVSDGWYFNKSDDTYIESEAMFVIYYDIERMQRYGN